MLITFTVTSGPLLGRTFTFEGHDVFLVGRSPNAHCRFPEDDPFFSRVHFIVEVNPPRCRLTDMGSRNGVFVNGERVERSHELRHKDDVQVGATHIRFRWPYGKKRRQASGEQEPKAPKPFKIRKAWIAFAGRIIAQMLGAAALIFLGLAIGGGLPQSCSTPAPNQSAPAQQRVAD